MVHLNGEMARDYVKGEFSAMQGSAGMPLLRKWDVYKKGRTSVFILYNSSFIITIHTSRISHSISIFYYFFYSPLLLESALIQLGLGLRTVTYQTLPYRTVHSQYT